MSSDKQIGQYRIVRTLGAGGMGTVYLGEHLLLGRRAAIKTLLPALSSHREIVDRFFNEARAISAISDPGVVQVFDFGYHVDGTAYIVMEYLEGESLATRLGRLGSLRLGEALRIARQLTSSLAAAHARGIIHRDLKPGNVFVIRDPEVQGGERAKILDFGICKVGMTDDASATQTGTMLGTPVYMSPEQCRGGGRIDHRADIYSLGCVLFHMACGRPPFDCESTGDYIASHIKEPAPIPSTISRAVPPAVDELMARCLAKDPARRYQSMAEVQQAIERALAHISDHGASEADPVRRTTPLGEGFQSSYDVNAGEDAASLAWFVDSLDAASISEDYEITKPRWMWGRGFAYVCALVLGVASGLAGASYALEARAAAEPTPPAAPEVAAFEELELADAVTAHEIAPPEPVADPSPSTPLQLAPIAPPRVAPILPPRPPKSLAARPPRAQVAKPAQPRPVVRTPAPARKPAPAPRPAPKPAPEDLYDSR